MVEIDIWADNPIITSTDNAGGSFLVEESPVLFPEIEVDEDSTVIKILEENGVSKVLMYTTEMIPVAEYENFVNVEEYEYGNVKVCKFSLTPLNSYVLRYLLLHMHPQIEVEVGKRLGEQANMVPKPVATLSDDKTNIYISIPLLKSYKTIMSKINAYPVKAGYYKANLNTFFELEHLSSIMETRFPRIFIHETLKEMNSEPIPGYDGSIDSLKYVPLSVLNYVNANKQFGASLKKDGSSIEEKFNKSGINNCYDLLLLLPKRYIDKSNPLTIDELIENEEFVLLGTILSVNTFSNGTGVYFEVADSKGSVVRASFFRQAWLTQKFKVGEQVLVSGKINYYNGFKSINGKTIEHADEASLIPIVPIYKQFASKGITTKVIMSATRELLSRLGSIKLPFYLKQGKRLDYGQAVQELHFPSSLENHNKALETLSYYELVYMQLLIQDEKLNNLNKPGIVQKGVKKLQAKAIKLLPFELTNSQKKSVLAINKSLHSDKPSNILLNADVGFGKTIVMQLAALESVDAGYQAVLSAPTEILAKQLYDKTIAIAESLKNYGDTVRVCFVSSSLKVKEKRVLKEAIKNGEYDIIVGTHMVLSAIDYYNIGFVCIDEEQKFSVEIRDNLLSSRSDGLIPDKITSTATPVPRSTAQVIYGDMDILTMDEKPPGRIPIITEWVEEEPQEFTLQSTNKVWDRIITEAEKGNKAFIITPLVEESDKIEASSVHATFDNLSKNALSHLKLSYITGRMKRAEIDENMQKFKNGEYDVMIASTVVEVGVDVPDATTMVILSAERLGGASLHQIRGRVGRSDKPSKCYLVSLGKNENSRRRIQSLVDNESGLKVAEEDLKNRGEGNVFGTKQVGKSELVFVNVMKHKHLIDDAKKEALDILNNDNSAIRTQALEDARIKIEKKENII